VDNRLQNSNERFCRADLISLRSGSGQYLVYSKNSRSAHILPASTTDLLNVCASFKSLSEHAQSCYNFLNAIQQRPDASREQFIIAQLEELMRLGLLVPESRLRQFYREHGEAESNPKISSVGVVTRDRIPSLKRCLLSYVANAKEHGRTHDFVVMDDSDSPAARATTVQFLRSMKKDHEVETRYAGLTEKNLSLRLERYS
jgi:hypothetical protein